MLMINTPLPSASISAATSRQRYNVPITFTRIVCSNSSGGTFSGTTAPSAATPAPLSQDVDPAKAGPCRRHHRRNRGGVADVTRQRKGLHAERLNLRGKLLEPIDTPCNQDDVRPRGSEGTHKRHAESG